MKVITIHIDNEFKGESEVTDDQLVKIKEILEPNSKMFEYDIIIENFVATLLDKQKKEILEDISKAYKEAKKTSDDDIDICIAYMRNMADVIDKLK